MIKHLNIFLQRAYTVHANKKLFILYCFICSNFSFGQIPLVPYRSGDKWCYADTSGKIKIPAFTNFLPMLFDEKGFAHFYDETGRYGLIDTTGKILLKPEFENIEINFPYCIIGRYTELNYQTHINYNVKDSARLYYLNGKPIFKYAIEDYIFHHTAPNRLMIIKNNNILLFDINWKTKTTRLIIKFKQATFGGNNFNNGVIGFSIVTLGKKGQHISKNYNMNGKLTDVPFELPVSEPYNSSEQGYKDIGAPMMDDFEFTPVITKRGNRYTLYDNPDHKNAKYYDLIIPVYSKNDYFYCRLNNQWGLAYKNGLELIEPGYDTIVPCRFFNNVRMQGFGNFLFMQWLVKNNGKWGVINTDRPIFNIPVLYDSIFTENTYHYLVKNNGNWSIINDTGKIEIEAEMNLSYNDLNKIAILANYRNILIAGKVKNGYQLYSNLPIPLNEIYDTVTINNRRNYDYLILEQNGLKGKAFEWNNRFYIIPCKYNSILEKDKDIEFGSCRFSLVRLPNSSLGYVRQDGKEFFEP